MILLQQKMKHMVYIQFLLMFLNLRIQWCENASSYAVFSCHSYISSPLLLHVLCCIFICSRLSLACMQFFLFWRHVRPCNLQMMHVLHPLMHMRIVLILQCYSIKVATAYPRLSCMFKP